MEYSGYPYFIEATEIVVGKGERRRGEGEGEKRGRVLG